MSCCNLAGFNVGVGGLDQHGKCSVRHGVAACTDIREFVLVSESRVVVMVCRPLSSSPPFTYATSWLVPGMPGLLDTGNAFLECLETIQWMVQWLTKQFD